MHDDLIKRLETATGPDKSTDAAIDAELKIGKPHFPPWMRNNFPVWRARDDGRVELVHDNGSGGVHWETERFTTSIDAALTLVPEGWEWSLHFETNAYRVEMGDPLIGLEGRSALAAIAICIAALRARITSGADQPGTEGIVPNPSSGSVGRI